MKGGQKWNIYSIISKLWPPQCKFKTVIFWKSRAVSMCVHVHTYKTRILEHCGFEITTAVRLHLLLCCLDHYLGASGPHLVVWAVWTSSKASSTRATENMAVLRADNSSLQAGVEQMGLAFGAQDLNVVNVNVFVISLQPHWVQGCCNAQQITE